MASLCFFLIELFLLFRVWVVGGWVGVFAGEGLWPYEIDIHTPNCAIVSPDMLVFVC